MQISCLMDKNTFIQTHSMQSTLKSDITDYSEKNNHFIQCLKAMEAMTDLDAYIWDYQNQQIIYTTRACSFNQGNSLKSIKECGSNYYEKIMIPEDVEMLAPVNIKAFELFYSVPEKRRWNYCYTFDFRIRNKKGEIILINHKMTTLDLTNEGIIRLGLCVISYPTNETPGNIYVKMNDTLTVYKYIKTAQTFVEIKAKRVSSNADTILNLASTGKTEAEIAKILNISIHTVKYHKKKIFTQLKVKNTAEAIQCINNQKRIVKR